MNQTSKRGAFLYSTKQTPRGSVVVLGDRLVSDELTTEEAQHAADWLNYRKIARP
jgi:hypothetical protein